MPIPSYEALLLPMLRVFSSQKEQTLRETEPLLAKEFALSEAERQQPLPSGKQTMFYNRMGWARTYLGKAKFLESEKRSYWKITQRGLEFLQSGATTLNARDLEQYPEFSEFIKAVNLTDMTDVGKPGGRVHDQTPEETIAYGNKQLRQTLIEVLQDKMQECTPQFFEQLVLDVLVAIGYGTSSTVQRVGRSGDGGIDGVIPEDKLGLNTIYVQAKRWDKNRTVGRPDIQQFAGALEGSGGSKGVFITTADYTKEAKNYVATLLQKKIVLIAGQELAELMIDHNVGVSVYQTHVLKRLDSDYFSEE